MRSAVSALYAFLGLIVGILLVSGMTDRGSPFLIAAGVIFGILVLVVVIRFFLMRKKKEVDTDSLKGHGEGAEVGFVVDTFHDVVGKLKEKENELERLKAFAEEKAIRMEAYNENILQSVPSGVISIDNSMQIKSVNQAAERILGIEAKETVDKNFRDVFTDPLKTLIREEKTVSREEYAYVTNDNRNIWLGITSSKLKNVSGEQIGLIFVFTDLTDIKQLQTQVELKQRLSQLGAMSAGIAHELRNSMSVISGYAKLLGRKVDNEGKPTVHSIMTEIQHMNQIISELLSFARPTDLSMGRVHINELIGQIVGPASEDHVSLRIAVNGDDEIYVNADELLMKQALSNVVINAIEAMPSGGAIDIAMRKVHDRAEIEIRDTGPGVPEDIRQKIFLPFYTTKEEGIGFGLALVQKIIVSHGGTIHVNTGSGHGAVFVISLPAME
jgi:two-component system sensor histidine kinase HydH